MKRLFYVFAAALMMLPVSASAQTKKDAVKDQLENHFKFYGFIRNYFTLDSRESVAGTADFFMYVPKDQNISASGVDLNQETTFRFLSITSRLGVDVSGYQIGGTKIGAKVETDFYSGLSGSTGTAALRLRQAYLTLGWEQEKTSESLKIGQAWHPMAADMPDVFSLNTGAPFGPFSRTPLTQLDVNFGSNFSLTAAAIWQMQYTSAGPDGASANYIKYSCVPEMYLGVSANFGGFLARAGVDVLSISPRHNNGVDKVSDRITTVSPFVYAQYKTTIGEVPFSVKAKTIFAEAGEHVSLNGGYAIKTIESDGSYTYTPTRNSSTWVSLSIGKKYQGVLFGGYVKNFGTKDAVAGVLGVPAGYYFSKNSFNNLNQMWRITPAFIYNLGKLALGLEYEATSVQYGDKSKGMNLETGLYEEGLHWVTNNRVQALVKFTF